MNEKINWLIGRRSIRRYAPDPIPEEFVEQLTTAAIWAPSPHNRQPWRFAVITKADTKHQLASAMGEKLRSDLTTDGLPRRVIEKDVSRSYQRITNAPLLILLCLTMVDMDSYPDDIRRRNEWVMAVQGTAMAGQNLLLAAYALGLGACWMCAPLFCPDIVRGALSLPEDWQPQGLITIGYPAETRQKQRMPMDTRLLFFR
jgi:F420 biosynthesis protein FbiB-like protein